MLETTELFAGVLLIILGGVASILNKYVLLLPRLPTLSIALVWKYQMPSLSPVLFSVWLVTCERGQQIDRLTARNGLTRNEAERRIDAQPPLEPKMAFVDEVIDNSGTIDETRRQIVTAWERLNAHPA